MVNHKLSLSEDSTGFVDHPVWCTRCCLRIAPYENQVKIHEKAKGNGKVYHDGCYQKMLLARARNMRQKQEARLKKQKLAQEAAVPRERKTNRDYGFEPSF